jgi:hypothetical protein
MNEGITVDDDETIADNWVRSSQTMQQNCLQ